MYRIKFFVLAVVACLGSLFSAWGQEVFTVDKVVAVVGNSAILYSEVVETKKELAQQYREMGVTSPREPMTEALEKLIITQLLYHQSQIDSLEINEGNIEEGVNQLISQEIAQMGSLEAFEKHYGKRMFIVKKELEDKYRKQYFAGAMEYGVREAVKISQSEVDDFFRSMPKDSIPIIPIQYSYSQIVMFPVAKAEANFRARQRLLEYRERIVNGERFATIARMYSDDPGSARNGGEYPAMDKGAFTRPYGDVLSKLKPGQISEIVETEFGFHIIEVLGKEGDKYRTRHILIRPQYTDQNYSDMLSKLDSVRSEIISGYISFDDAALKYSDDKYSKNNGGKASNIEYLYLKSDSDVNKATTIFFIDNIAPKDYDALSKLKVGGISPVYYTTDLRENAIGKIVRLDAITAAHLADIDKDYVAIQAAALENKRNKEFLVWLNKKAYGMYIRVDDEFKDSQFTLDFLTKK